MSGLGPGPVESTVPDKAFVFRIWEFLSPYYPRKKKDPFYINIRNPIPQKV